MINDITKLNRGSAYSFIFSDGTRLDALLIDFSAFGAEEKSLELYRIQGEERVICTDELLQIDNTLFLQAEPIPMTNDPAFLETLHEKIEEIRQAGSGNSTISDEEDLIDAIEFRQDHHAAAKLLEDLYSDAQNTALTAAGCILNNLPFLLKRVPQNHVAFLLLFAAVEKVCACKNWGTQQQLPVLPVQDDPCSVTNVTVLRKAGYQLRNMLEPKLLEAPVFSGRRYIGYVQTVQRTNKRGQILFAGTERLNFKFRHIADMRLINILERTLAVAGGIEVEFSIGYNPEQGGLQVSPCCRDIVLTKNGIALYRASSDSIWIPDAFVLSEEFRICPVCPTAYLSTDYLVVQNRLIRDGRIYDGYPDAPTECQLFHPMGTKRGRIAHFAKRPAMDGRIIGEGEIACEGNMIHFNSMQVVDAKLHQCLLEDPSSCIGREVELELAFNARKNALAMWADVVRPADSLIQPPPEYDPSERWTLQRSQLPWEPQEGVSPVYVALQPWLPIMNALLDKCEYGELDTSSLRGIAPTASITAVPTEGRIFLDRNRSRWCKFHFSSVAERYLLSALFSSLRFNMAEAGTEGGISVIFARTPSSDPGRFMADWIILSALGRGELRRKLGADISCAVNRDGNMLLDITDGFVPLNIWNKPKSLQLRAIQQLDQPNLFDNSFLTGVVTQFYGTQGIISVTDNNTWFPFSADQIADQQLRNTMAESRYANYPVRFRKRQAAVAKNKKLVAPLAADYIMSGNARPDMLELCPQYRSLANLLPSSGKVHTVPEEAGQDTETTEKPNTSLRDRSIRQGVLLCEPGRNDQFVIVDEHPFLWTINNIKHVVSHLQCSTQHISDNTLLQQVSTGRPQQVQVVYHLVRTGENELPVADCVRLRENADRAHRQGYEPHGAALSAAEIEEAQRLCGKVVINSGPVAVFVQVDSNTAYQAEGFEKQNSFHACTNDPQHNRFYVLDQNLQHALFNQERNQNVSFIPVAAYQSGRPPEAAFILLDGRVPEYVYKMPPKPYAANVFKEQPSERAVVRSDVETELLYYLQPNAFDQLINGKGDQLNGHFEQARRMFAAPETPNHVANIQMMQKGLEGGVYCGINNVARELRYAYADALVRNQQIIFGEYDGYLRMLNTLVDIYMGRSTGLLSAYDKRGYAVLEKLGQELRKIVGDSFRVKQIQGRLDRLNELKSNGIVSPDAAPFTPDLLETGKSAPQAVVVPLRSKLDQMIEDIPFLYMKQVHEEDHAESLLQWRDDMNMTRDCNFMMSVYRSGQLTANEHHSFLRSLMDSILNEAEKTRIADRHNRYSLYEASYLYSAVIRLFFMEQEREPHAWNLEEKNKYLDFSKRMLSLQFTGTEPYREQIKDAKIVRRSLIRLKNERGDLLWRLASELVMDRLLLVPEIKEANAADQKDKARQYLFMLLESIWFSSRSVQEFLSREEYDALSNKNTFWGQLVEEVCADYGMPEGERSLDQLSETYSGVMQQLMDVIPDLSEHSAQGLIRLGDPEREPSVLWQMRTLLDKTGHRSRWIGELFSQLDQVRRAQEKERVSEQNAVLNQAQEVLTSRKRILEKHDSFEGQLLLTFVHHALATVQQLLLNNTRDDVPPKVIAGQSSVNQQNEYITAVIVQSDARTLLRIDMNLQLASVPDYLTPLGEPIRAFDLGGSEERTFELRFRINEDTETFRQRQTVPIGISYSCAVSCFAEDRGSITEYSTVTDILLNYQVASEKWLIMPGSFNPSNTDYAEAVAGNENVRNQFVGREAELEKLWAGIYDANIGRYKRSVGMTIAGRRRTGKSWLAGKFCEQLRQRSEGQIIVCDRVDVSSVERPGDLTEKIIIAVVKAMSNEGDFVQRVYDELKPNFLFDYLAEQLNGIQRFDVLELLNSLKVQLDACGIRNAVSFPAFFHELSENYLREKGHDMPPILITLDEFTSVQEKISKGIMTRDELLAIIKLTENYPINTLLICADNFASVKTYVDENAFLHYKVQVEVDGIKERETVRMLNRPIPVRSLDAEQQTERRCIDAAVAKELHRWYDGNVYLLAVAAEHIVDYMNSNGYAYFESYHLQENTFTRELLQLTTKDEALHAYIEDGRMLDDQFTALVLRWLNIQAMACVAAEGGRCPREKVFARVQNEYGLLFFDTDRSRLIDLLRERLRFDPEELPGIAERIMQQISPVKVIDWLLERGVFRMDGDMVALPLMAYVEARKHPGLRCLELEQPPVYADSTVIVDDSSPVYENSSTINFDD